MEKDSSAAAQETRARVIVFLALLTSEALWTAGCQLLQPGRLAFELCRLWLDEIYTPGIRYLDGLKGDRCEEAAARFQACFTPEERAALERFHCFLELRMDMLPETDRQRAFFPQNDSWENLVRDAAYLLEDLAAERTALQDALSWMARTLADRNAPGPLPAPAWRTLLDERGGST